MRRVKKILKVLAVAVASLLVVALLLAAFSQTQIFRDRLRDAALSSLDSLLDAEVQLGNISGNLISGFSVDHISIKVRNDFFLVARRIDLQYDLFQLPGKTISINVLRIIHPELNLLRGRDGEWNFRHMIRSKAEDTTKSTLFDWVIRVNRVELQQGMLRLVDSASLASDDHLPPDPTHVDYHQFAIQELNLVTSILVKPDEKQARISSLPFLCEQPQFRVKDASGEFVVLPNHTHIRNLHIGTDRSDVRLSATMDRVDLLGGLDLTKLRDVPVRFSLDAHNLDLNELTLLLPELGFLNGSISLDAEAEGEFGNLYVKQLDCTMGKTQLLLKGSVYNLHDPGNLMLNVLSTESKIYSPDVLQLLPKFRLPDYESLGVTKLNMEFVGKPLDFKSKFLVETNAGNVKGDVSLVIGGPYTLAYKGELTAHNLDLALIVGERRLTSSLNGAITIDGTGVAFDRWTSSCSLRIDSSTFMGKPVSRSLVSLSAKERVVTGTARLGVGLTSAALSGRLDAGDSHAPSFSLKGTVSSLNLQEVLDDPSYNSDLTLAIDASGTGLTWETLNGDFLVSLSQSRFRDYSVTADSIHVTLDQRDSVNKSFSFESTIADFSLSGKYDVGYLIRLLPYEVENLRTAVAERLHQIDSSGRTPAEMRTLATVRQELMAAPVVLNATYTLRLKNLEPISIATGNKEFNGSGTFSGTVIGDVNRLHLDGQLRLDAFFYGTAESGFLVQKGTGSFMLKELTPFTPLNDADASAAFEAQVMHIGRTKLDSLRLNLRYQHGSASYAGQAVVGDEVRLGIQGLTNESEDQAVFVINNLLVAYQDYAWTADEGASVSFGKEGIRLKDLVMRRDAQTVTLTGFLGNDETLEGSVIGSRLDVAALKYLMSPEESRYTRDPFTGTTDLAITARGTVSRPEYTGSVHAERITFRAVPFGRLQGEFAYKDEALTAQVELDSRALRTEGHPDLTIVGTLPINLALTGVEQRLPEAPMDLSIRSDGIQMSILDPLIPTLYELSGILRCNLKVVGSPRQPNYEGNIRIDSCAFLFVPNNIRYLFEGTFQPKGERIQVVEAIARNVPEDEEFGRKGLTRITGDFALREFRPTDFNLTAEGQLLVVKESTLRSELSVYGNLFVEVGEQPLHFTGTIEHSLLKGSLTVRNSSLVFPPAQTQVAKQYSSTVPFLVVNDTVKVIDEGDRSVLHRYFGLVRDSSQRAMQLPPEVAPSFSFTDGLRYDLQITTQGGNTELRMVFYNAPPEELVATINGKFTITEDGRKWYGDLRVDKAYYLFYNKQFDASGSLRYTGDFLNPELDITATYAGTRVLADTASSDRAARGPERIVVTVKITGRRLEPSVAMSMTIDDEDYASYNKGPKSGDVQTDAISFIVTGTFPLTKTEKNDVADNLGKTVGASLITGATSLLSGALSEFVRRQTGFITSLEFGQLRWGETPDIRLSGVAAGGLWRYGGKINDPLNNISIGILYSLGDVFDAPSLRNFMLELEQRRQEAVTSTQNREQAIRSARLFYRISF